MATLRSSWLLFIALCFLCTFAADEGGLPVMPLPAFPCVPYTVDPNEPPPTDINHLAPHNIDVVMSMGDSITAAFGATAEKIFTLPFVPREDRYLSYTNGGGAMQYTVLDFLSLYNKNVQGGSSGTTLPIDALEIQDHHLENYKTKVVGLNGALSGAKIQDIPQEIDFLIDQMKNLYSDTIDFNNSWKLATLLIGANNLCVVCHNNTADTPETFGQLLNSSIAQMYSSIPRVRLNILPIFNITQVYYWSRTNEYCTRIWDLLDECPCLSSKSSTEQDHHAVNVAAVQYRLVLEQVVAYWQSQSLKDFAVSVQPFTASLKIINGALTSNFDCFHPSELSHSYIGSVLWNSLWLPPSQKPTNTTQIMLNGVEFICPDRYTYMQ